ncbi:hypothetical protein JTB14_017828 [Gonioctena quinquepunctata]|nr:hypothetical protein JTB14_017828 [Gonioctena quinquepunctata]
MEKGKYLCLTILCSGKSKKLLGFQIFSDWKSAVRKRARAIKVGERKTGGGPSEKPPNDLEQKLMDLSGVVVIDGFAGVPKLGLLMNVSPVKTTLEASNDKLSIDQTDNVQPGSCLRRNPAVSKMWTGSEHGSLPPKKNSKNLSRSAVLLLVQFRPT